ncbi:hypothetical protein [Thiohalophilus sp.]|uniref:hypothetical protein n=1 Tax=Thiohalophilus sp. TaxID=3028392 RepID=UPI002ACD53F4|nr:hypothetical protein [Thiohalophilus sp.]MDZ7802386.1 hypothetical protein [Thiohalophilus sp.]
MKRYYMKPFITNDGLEARKAIDAYVTDNTCTVGAINDLFWFHTIVIPINDERKSA